MAVFPSLDLWIIFNNAYLSLGTGRGHNRETNFIDFFHFSDHLEQFEGVLFLGGKNEYFNGWGVIPPPQMW